MFKIAKIGIEFEFDIPLKIDRVMPFAEAFVREWNQTDTKWFIIEVDREYYSNQIEFKLRATDNIEEWLAYFQQFIHGCYQHMSDISCIGTPFVWTHMHLFLEKDWVPYDKMARGKKMPIFSYMYRKFEEFLSFNPENLKWDIVRNEALRLASNHNILRYFDSTYLKNWIKRNLERHWLCYPMFHRWIDRPKYAPVIWSFANIVTWKPHSLELRAIPNSWLITAPPEELYEFVCQIESILNERHNPRIDYAASIIETNRKLIRLSSTRY